jgi:Glycosyltransferase
MTGCRRVPCNCIVHAPLIKNTKTRYIQGLFSLRSAKYLGSELFSKYVFTNTKRFKTWLVGYIQLNNLLASSEVKNIFNNINKEDVCYFYWGKGSNMLSVVYKRKAHFVSRFHGEWDLWEESSGCYAPLRKIIAESLDRVICISRKGEEYFKQRYPKCKTEYFPLGSNDYGTSKIDTRKDALRVVSCSMVYSLKRVPLIFDALNAMNISIEWVHLGGGKDFEYLKARVDSDCKPHLTVELKGMMTHDEIMKYYKQNYFDLFVNMSINEGVPVSIMEATSFDIPVLATNVGGTSEIVQPQVGELLSANPSVDEICAQIRTMIMRSYQPRVFWSKNFSAENNYMKFGKMLKSL